jgi:hypothetical protein
MKGQLPFDNQTITVFHIFLPTSHHLGRLLYGFGMKLHAFVRKSTHSNFPMTFPFFSDGRHSIPSEDTKLR